MPPTPATASLIQSIDGVRRRVQRLSVMRGAGQLVAAGIGTVFLYLLVDYLLNLPVVPRSIVFAAGVMAIGIAAARWIVGPILARVSLSDVAGRLENRFPQFEDGLRSTLDFLRPEMPGSEAMKHRTVERAVTQAATVDLLGAVDPMPTWIAIGQAGAAFLIIMLLAALVGPQIRSTAIAHLFNPLSHQAWPRRVEIASDNAIPQRVPVGQSIDVRIKLVRGDRASVRSTLCYQYDSGPVQQELMSRGDNGVYSAALDPRIDPDKHAGTLHVWIKAGDDQLDLAPVTVVPRLTVQSVEAHVVPPNYVTGQSTLTTNLQAGPASMVEGSRVELALHFNKPLADADNAAPNVRLEPLAADEAHPAATQPSAPAIAWNRAGDLTAIGRFDASRSLRFHVHATDVDGFSNNALDEYQLIVRPDQMPSVQIEEPRQNEERTAVATIPLRAIAEDDLGISNLTLEVERLERAADSTRGSVASKPTTAPDDPSHWSIPLVSGGNASADTDWSPVQGTGDRKRFRAIHAWELASLKDAHLRPGDLLEYRLLVTDNYSVDGKTHPPVSSGKLRVGIISQDDLTARAIADLQTVKNQISDLKSAQSRANQETANLNDDLKNKPKLDDADRAAVGRLAAEQSSAAGRAQQIAEKVAKIGERLAENQSPQKDLQTLSRDVASDLNDTADKAMKMATQRLAQLPNDPTAEQRAASLADTKQSQQQANDNLQRALDRLGDIGSLQQTIARINELLKQQREVGEQTRAAGKDAVGKTPDQLSNDDRKKIEGAAAAQAKLAEQTSKAIDEMKKGAEQLAKSDPAAAEAMSKAAATAAQQQVSANQKKAAEQTKENQQSSAQSAQQQAELGLQMMAGDLQQAERRKLAQLAKQLDDLQQQIANLVRRQAGHNLDNLAVQGPATTQPAATIAELTAQAERDSGAPAPDVSRLAATLAPSEEQTSANTRDISRSSESLPDGAAAASQLLRAADHMDRAIVSLRDTKFAAAYDPPQVEALASLLIAKKTVDEQKAKVDDQINQSQKEAVRQRYVKLKEDQEKLNADVVRIDAVRDAQAALKRADAIRLGQLPGEQGALADRVNEIDKDLSALGSVVYTWANRDIASAMLTVKGDLPDVAKDAATVATQSRIVEQLDAMIRNLAIKPKVSKFANDNQGGGGGGGKGSAAPSLPSEAELRLLHDLQKSVNANTKSLDAVGKKDAPQASAIGNRQGELRRLLEQLLEKSAGGKLALGPEPDNRDQLPEEASQQDVENNELDQTLLNDKPTEQDEQKETNLIGQRMARSRQRLALNNDPGKVTQIIQERILKDFDALIDQARKQEAEIRNPPKSKGNGEKQSTPAEGIAKAQQQGQKGTGKPSAPAANPAQASTGTPPGGGATDLSKQIKESLAEWGQVTPRLRAAQIEGSSESIIEQYRKLTEDYYRSLATKAAQR